MKVWRTHSWLMACTAMIALNQTLPGMAQEQLQGQSAEQLPEAEMVQLPAAGVNYLSPIVVQGATGVDPYATPGPVSAISSEEIEQFGGKNIDDVLRATPGVFTRDNVQNPGVAVNIRGLEGSGRVNMMIDGVRQNFRFTGHEAQGLAYMDPSFLSGVDITRGYVSGVGGGNALVGAVNFRTWDVDDILTGGKNFGGFATATFGTNRGGWSEAAVAAYRPNDVISFLAGISKRDPGNYKNGDGQVVSFTESDVISGLFKFELTPSDEHRIRFGANIFNDDFMANSYYQTVKSRTFNLGYTYQPSDNDLVDFAANVYRTQLIMNYDEAVTGGGSAAGREIDNVGTGFDVSNTSRFALGAVDVKANYGLEYFSDDYDAINSRLAPDNGVNGSGTNANYSIFSSTQFSYGIADLNVGLRYDHFNIKGSGSVVAANPIGLPGGPYEVDRSGGQVNPSVTLALNPVEWFQPYVTYSHTSRPPTISETFIGGNHPGSGARQSYFPNPFLKPEKSRGWEVGANFAVNDLFTSGDSFRLKANYFNSRIEDYIVANPVGGLHFANVAGTSTVQGVEIQAAYDAGYMFGSLAYTHTDSKLPAQMNGLGAQSYVPENVFTATAGARFLEQRLTAGARLHVVSKSYIGEINDYFGRGAYEPGYELVDLFANYKFDSGFEISANVSNLFNKSYSPALSTSPNPYGPPETTGRGRTFFVTAKATF